MLLVLGAVACSGGDGDGPDDGAATTAPAPASGTAVVIVDFAFGPRALEVPVGGTVTWTNDDAFDHTVRDADGGFDSGPMAEADTFEFTFDAAGTYEYMCAIHPSMTATVTVT